MATQAARFVRAEFRENGFLVVGTKERKYKRTYGPPKAEMSVPKGAPESPSTHVHVIRQSEVIDAAFKVIRGDNGVVQIWRKEGSALKGCRSYYWTGTKLRLLTPQMVFHKNIQGVDGMELFKAQGRPGLTHEQLCDIERALIRL